MPELFRSRDTVILKKGNTINVAVSPDMAASGWSGGQGVQWAHSDRNDFEVTYSDGVSNGFILFGSDETADRFTASTRNQLVYRVAVMGAGGWIMATSNYEKYTWASRQAPPLVEQIYHASDKLYFSLRGLFTNEDEWTLSGDPRAPNTFIVGTVSQAPTTLNRAYLTVQVRI